MALDPKVRVLIADPDPVLCQQMHKRLMDTDVFADTLGDGRKAIERLREQDYAVLLLDLGLPHSGAESILEYLNRLAAERRPVILVLAEASAARSLDVEMVQIVLRKPFNLRQVTELVKSCVQAATSSAPAPSPALGAAAVVA